MSARAKLPATVVALALVSFFTDLSSEMIAPLLPAFLATLGSGAVFLGVLEGSAQTAASLVKLWSGVVADRLPRRKPLVVFGYGLSSVVRPLMALCVVPWQVFAVRFGDRIGKGLRGSPRDALMADVTPVAMRGRAYGFQRGMDHCGALLGPLVAFALLEWGELSLRSVFALAAIPAALAVGCAVFLVREGRRAPDVVTRRPAFGLPRSRVLRRYLVVVGVFALGNSSDLFLVARATDVGVPVTHVLLLWAAFHAIKSFASAPLGALSDRFGRRLVIGTGLVVYALVYLGFGFATEPWHAWVLFVAYGLHEAFTDGAEKALVADLAGDDERGRAFGTFHLIVGLTALPASLVFGSLWSAVGPALAFAVGAGLAVVAALLLWFWVRPDATVPAAGRPR